MHSHGLWRGWLCFVLSTGCLAPLESGGADAGREQRDAGPIEGGTDAGELDAGRPGRNLAAFSAEGQRFTLDEGAIVSVAIHEPGVVQFDARVPDGGGYPFGVSGSTALTPAQRGGDYLSYTSGLGVSYRSVTLPAMEVREAPRCPGDWFSLAFSGVVEGGVGNGALELRDGTIAGRVCYYPHGQPLPVGCGDCQGWCYPNCY